MKNGLLTGYAFRRRARRVAPWVLALWGIFLLLTFLQPCCEVLAASLPHDHGSLTADHHPGDESDGAPPDHEHCPQLQNLHSLLPDGAPPDVNVDRRPPVIAQGLLTTWPLLAGHQTAPTHLGHSGASPPLYLLTLRLRM